MIHDKFSEILNQHLEVTFEEVYPFLIFHGQAGQGLLVLVLSLTDIFFGMGILFHIHGRGDTYLGALDFDNALPFNTILDQKG